MNNNNGQAWYGYTAFLSALAVFEGRRSKRVLPSFARPPSGTSELREFTKGGSAAACSC